MNKAELIVGTGSTWSIRAWLCLKLANVEFSEQIIVLEKPDYKQALLKLSPTGLVPALHLDDVVIHDSLAITEFANELGQGVLYPDDVIDRALARSYCAELHAGFFNLRNTCPFALNTQAPAVITQPIQNELDRLTTIWSTAQGNYFYERPSIVDAFYAVLAYRLHIYNIELPGSAGKYQASLLEWPLFKEALLQAASWSE